MTAVKKHIAYSIHEYIRNNHQLMKLFLKKLVAIESPSSNRASQHNILQYLQNELDQLGFYTYRNLGNKTGGYLYARPKERDKNKAIQLLVGHCDTVWNINTLEQMPLVEREKKLLGPGVYDMKAGIAQIIFALKAIKHQLLSFPLEPIILINSDEEIGSIESTPIIKKLAKIVNRAYVLEPPLGRKGKLKTARKGVGKFTVKVKGKAAHAGLDPEKGVSAIVELSHQVQQLYAMNDFEKGITVNVGLIKGGNSPNVVAPESSAVIDVRVNSVDDGTYITNKIHQLKPFLEEIEIEIEGAIKRQPMEKTKRNQQLWELAKENSKLIGVKIDQAMAGGGSDGNTTSLFTATLDGLGTTGDGAHAQHEFIFLDKLTERTTLLALLLLEDTLIKT